MIVDRVHNFTSQFVDIMFFLVLSESTMIIEIVEVTSLSEIIWAATPQNASLNESLLFLNKLNQILILAFVELYVLLQNFYFFLVFLLLVL